MRRRATQEGLTLIEILLALIVMVLGILGILALFPPALQSSRESMEETNAAIIAESVADAIKTAIQFATMDQGTGQWTAVLTHDLQVPGAGGPVRRYQFILPEFKNTSNEWLHYPNTGTPDLGKPPNPDPATDTYFEMGEDPWIGATVDAVQKVNDRTDAYRQFAFSLEVRKINTLEYLLNPPGQVDSGGVPYTVDRVDSMLKLYEFRIHLFRVSRPVEGTYGGGAGTSTKKLITTVTNRVSTR